MSQDDITYHVVRSAKRRRTLMLKIERDGRVVMHVPHHTTEGEIRKFFEQKHAWVQTKLQERAKDLETLESERRYVTGEKFLYLGQKYPLELREASGRRSGLALSHGVFYLEKNHKKQGRDLFVEWYKERAREIFPERVNYYSRKFKLYPQEVRITGAKTRYGSCTADNKLYFSFRLVMAPYPMIDYVIAHELAHIKVKNHSRRFWNYMEEIMPGYKKYKDWLRVNSASLDI
ncbi:MAG TPA: SprT family zinc-dependent metalloprotease [Syntrophorhabdaceae bacterium]|nr:SprT family zinc-dependent metalloprotease [Syntrophorhabdaceae bacterium]